ncbi:MAG: hypothetical protein V2A71_07775 [Candidatus Eisenbacteria bacterium]
MDKIFAELEKKIERVASAMKTLKEENANFRSENLELLERTKKLQASGSSGEGTLKSLRSRIAELEGERDSLVDLRRQVEARLEGVLSRLEWLEK